MCFKHFVFFLINYFSIPATPDVFEENTKVLFVDFYLNSINFVLLFYKTDLFNPDYYFM